MGNQNVYKTTADTTKFAASGYCFSRGSTRVYPCQYHGITDASSANAIRGGSSADAAKGTVTHAGTPTDYSGTAATHPYMFIDNLGPFKVSAYTSQTAIKFDVTQMDGISKFYTASDYAKVTLNTYQVIDDADDLAAGSILLMNGRRYKTAAAQTSGSGEGGIALTETFVAPPTSSSAAAAPTAWPTAGPTPTPAVRSRPTATSAAASTSRGASSSCSALPPSSTLSCPWSWTRSPSSTTVPPPPRSASVPPLVPSAPCCHHRRQQRRCHLQGAQHRRLQARHCPRVRLQHQLPVRLPVLQPWRLRRLHRPLQLLQGLHQRQLRHPEHARRLNPLPARSHAAPQLEQASSNKQVAR